MGVFLSEVHSKIKKELEKRMDVTKRDEKGMYVRSTWMRAWSPADKDTIMCGGLLEGTPSQMFKSLNKLNSLPGNTKIYSAHEYTENNLQWALSLNSNDVYISERLKLVQNKLQQGLPSLPSTISEERKTNLFLKAKNVEELAMLRRHKDNWKC